MLVKSSWPRPRPSRPRPRPRDHPRLTKTKIGFSLTETKSRARWSWLEKHGLNIATAVLRRRFVKILLFASQVLWWSCQSFFTSITTISNLNLISKWVSYIWPKAPFTKRLFDTKGNSIFLILKKGSLYELNELNFVHWLNEVVTNKRRWNGVCSTDKEEPDLKWQNQHIRPVQVPSINPSIQVPVQLLTLWLPCYISFKFRVSHKNVWQRFCCYNCLSSLILPCQGVFVISAPILI